MTDKNSWVLFFDEKEKICQIKVLIDLYCQITIRETGMKLTDQLTGNR